MNRFKFTVTTTAEVDFDPDIYPKDISAEDALKLDVVTLLENPSILNELENFKIEVKGEQI